MTFKLNQDEVPSDDLVYATGYRKTVTTFGFEVEQPSELICYGLRSGSGYHWHFDGSGPLETTFGGGAFPASEVKKFYDAVNRTCPWDWVNEYYGMTTISREAKWRGCGSHIHFRVREGELRGHTEIVEAWTTAYNTLIECVPLLAPMFAWGTKGKNFAFRRTIGEWSGIETTRLSPISVYTKFLSNTERNFRSYKNVTFNPSSEDGKPLTLEVRSAETHVGFAYVVALLLNRFIRDCMERPTGSPKLRDRTRVLEQIERAITKSSYVNEDGYPYYGNNLYEEMQNEIGEISFLPGRGIPRMEETYPDWDSFFNDIFTRHTAKYPPMNRVMKFYKHRGIPCENSRSIWDLFKPKGGFHWEQDIKAK